MKLSLIPATDVSLGDEVSLRNNLPLQLQMFVPLKITLLGGDCWVVLGQNCRRRCIIIDIVSATELF